MKNSLEFKVGLMTIMALLVLMVSLLFVNNFRFGGGGKTYTVTFHFLGDLKADAPVKYAGGIDVGQVKAIRASNGAALVDLLISDPNIKLRKDSQLAIYSTSLLGTKYVQIQADLGKDSELRPGDTLLGKDSNNLDLTFSQLGDVMETFEKMMGDPKAQENFLHSFDNMNKATDNIYQLTITSKDKIEKILDEISKSSGEAGELMVSVKRVSNSLNSLTKSMNKKDIKESLENLNATLKNMNQLTTDIRNSKGSVGLLMNDEKMADDIKKLVEELKAHPWKLLWKN